MKKLLCCLMAVLMLTGSAMAEEAYELTITMECTPADCRMIVDSMMDLEEDRAEKAAEAFAKLISDIGVTVHAQGNGFTAAVSLGDTSVIDLGLVEDGGESYIISNVLPGHALMLPKTAQDTSLDLLQTDWQSVLTDLESVWVGWLEQIHSVEETGVFMGDAYEYGVRRVIFRFDDAAVASLLEKLAGVLEIHGLGDGLISQLTGMGNVLTDFRSENAAVAQANRYQYQLQLVYGDQGGLIGISLTTNEGDEQVMTLSVGIASNGVQFVWGYGLNDVNYYIEGVLIDEGTDDEALRLGYSLTVYEDSEFRTYRAVEPYLDFVKQMSSGSLEARTEGDAIVWRNKYEAYDAEMTEHDFLHVMDGRFDTVKMTLDVTSVTSALYDDGRTDMLETIRIGMKPTEPVDLSANGLTVIRMDDDSEETTALLDALIEESAMEIGLTLFKKLPSEVLMLLMN